MQDSTSKKHSNRKTNQNSIAHKNLTSESSVIPIDDIEPHSDLISAYTDPYIAHKEEKIMRYAESKQINQSKPLKQSKKHNKKSNRHKPSANNSASINDEVELYQYKFPDSVLKSNALSITHGEKTVSVSPHNTLTRQYGAARIPSDDVLKFELPDLKDQDINIIKKEIIDFGIAYKSEKNQLNTAFSLSNKDEVKMTRSVKLDYSHPDHPNNTSYIQLSRFICLLNSYKKRQFIAEQHNVEVILDTHPSPQTALEISTFVLLTRGAERLAIHSEELNKILANKQDTSSANKASTSRDTENSFLLRNQAQNELQIFDDEVSWILGANKYGSPTQINNNKSILNRIPLEIRRFRYIDCLDESLFLTETALVKLLEIEKMQYEQLMNKTQRGADNIIRRLNTLEESIAIEETPIKIYFKGCCICIWLTNAPMSVNKSLMVEHQEKRLTLKIPRSHIGELCKEIDTPIIKYYEHNKDNPLSLPKLIKKERDLLAKAMKKSLDNKLHRGSPIKLNDLSEITIRIGLAISHLDDELYITEELLMALANIFSNPDRDLADTICITKNNDSLCILNTLLLHREDKGSLVYKSDLLKLLTHHKNGLANSSNANSQLEICQAFRKPCQKDNNDKESCPPFFISNAEVDKLLQLLESNMPLPLRSIITTVDNAATLKIEQFGLFMHCHKDLENKAIFPTSMLRKLLNMNLSDIDSDARNPFVIWLDKEISNATETDCSTEPSSSMSPTDSSSTINQVTLDNVVRSSSAARS